MSFVCEGVTHCMKCAKILKMDEIGMCKECKKRNKETEASLYKHLYNKTLEDFENYKEGKDINYLDGHHHKKLVEKSLGQIIKEPENCWFDAIEVRIIMEKRLYYLGPEVDFITLKEISDKHPDNSITVIAEGPLSGAIYRYNNYGDKEWQLIGNMFGYA